MITQILVPVVGTMLCYVLFHAGQILYAELTSPLRDLDGPHNPNLIMGNFKELSEDPYITSKWRKQFGPIFRFRSLFSGSQLHILDVTALNHILSHGALYHKPPFLLTDGMRLLGPGVFSVESDDHRRQRRILNNAFGVAQIRHLTEIFVEKSVQLRDMWITEIKQANGPVRMDVYPWLRRMTLDVIGQAGFDYSFGALQKEEGSNELDKLFTEIFHSPNSQRIRGYHAAQSMVPILRLVPVPGSRAFAQARARMSAIANEILAKSKAAIKTSSTDLGQLGGKRDLLSILLKANMSPDVPERMRLSDAEVVAQIPTFNFAGHETTSTAVSWALHALSLNTAAQSKLRQEVSTLQTDNPTMDELNSLPYLESVVRETMRLHAPVVFTSRIATQEDVLPLSKPYVDKKGNVHDSLVVPKGQLVHIPVLAVNTSKEIWGEDAEEFIPERWVKVPEAASAIPGVWANLLTFLAGPHNCIGFRFSIVESKVLLFVLLRAFEFEPGVPKGGIVPTPFALQRPMIAAEPEKGDSLPLIVKPLTE